MTTWVGYAKANCEMQVQADARALGIIADVALKIEGIRKGKQRWPEAVTSPVISNYIFFRCTDAQWHDLRHVKNLSATMRPVPDRTAARQITPFLTLAAIEYDARKAALDAGERVAQYQDGDALMIMAGKLTGQLVTFRAMIEAGDNGFPSVIGELPGTIGGKAMQLRLDPLNVRRA